MLLLGIDIGTTTISGVVVKNGTVLSSITRKNDGNLPGAYPWEKLQDPDFIHKTALEIVSTLLKEYPRVERIGVTGQMHGIVYLDKHGHPVSPLYTWQDGRGEQPFSEEETYAQHLSALTGHPLATGFGTVTHYYNLHNGLVPGNAAVFCTIHDYIAMILAGRTRPVTDTSDGASLGLFDVKHGIFDLDAIKVAGFDDRILPELAHAACIGSFQDKIPVYAAIGDNQASFLGTTAGNLQAMLVNMGTGGQFCAYTKDYITCPGLETRPFPLGGYLVTGSSLCGGRAYALLERFWASAAEMVSGQQTECYDAMDWLLGSASKPTDLPTLTPLFQGTRSSPQLRGSITDLSTENFTPLHFTWAMLEGMAEELYRMYESYLAAGGTSDFLMGSGNGIRKNRYLQQCISEKFGIPLTLSSCCEEAATGAALFAGSAQ